MMNLYFLCTEIIQCVLQDNLKRGENDTAGNKVIGSVLPQKMKG